MLFQLENASRENINRLLEFAGSHNIKLELVDDAQSNYYLPGKPLSTEELLTLVKKKPEQWHCSHAGGSQCFKESV